MHILNIKNAWGFFFTYTSIYDFININSMSFYRINSSFLFMNTIYSLLKRIFWFVMGIRRTEFFFFVNLYNYYFEKFIETHRNKTHQSTAMNLKLLSYSNTWTNFLCCFDSIASKWYFYLLFIFHHVNPLPMRNPFDRQYKKKLRFIFCFWYKFDLSLKIPVNIDIE